MRLFRETSNLTLAVVIFVPKSRVKRDFGADLRLTRKSGTKIATKRVVFSGAVEISTPVEIFGCSSKMALYRAIFVFDLRARYKSDVEIAPYVRFRYKNCTVKGHFWELVGGECNSTPTPSIGVSHADRRKKINGQTG